MSEQEQTTTRVCALCGAVVGAREACQHCTEQMALLPDPNTMTTAERVAEFDRYKSPLTVPFDLLHGRIEQLFRRPVYTHEFAQWDRLRIELLSGEPPTTEQIINKVTEINPAAKVIVIDDES